MPSLPISVQKTHVVARTHLDGLRATLACGQNGALTKDAVVLDNGRRNRIAVFAPTCKGCLRSLHGVAHPFKGLMLCEGKVRVDTAVELYEQLGSWDAVADKLRKRNGARYQPISIYIAVWKSDHYGTVDKDRPRRLPEKSSKGRRWFKDRDVRAPSKPIFYPDYRSGTVSRSPPRVR